MSDFGEPWEMVRIRDCFEVWGGMTPSTCEPSFWGGSIPWISSKDVKCPRLKSGTEFLTVKALQATRLRKCRPGSVLVVVRSGVLAHSLPVAVASSALAVNQDLKVFDPGDDSVNEWFALYLRAHARDILNASRKDGTTVQSVRMDDLLDRSLPLPLAHERDQIRKRVEVLLDSVERAERCLALVSPLLKRFRQAVLAAACSGRLTEEWREAAYGAAYSGGLPRGWGSRSLADVASKDSRAIRSGPFGSNLKHSEFRPTGRLVIGIDNVGDGLFLPGKQHRLAESKYQELIRYRARPGGVLITVMATVGRVCVAPDDLEPAIITKHVYRITTDPSVMIPGFLAIALRGGPDVTEQIQEQVRGQTRPGINGPILKSLRLQVPPVEEQEEAVRRARVLLDLAQEVETRVGRVRTVTAQLSDSVLQQAFQGNLVARAS